MNDLNQKIPQLTVVLVSLIGLGLALYMGRGLGQGNIAPAAIIIGGLAAMAVYLTLGKNAWMLMVFCWPLGGKISVLPLPFSVHDLGVFAAFAAFLASMIFKKRQNKPLVEKIDVLLWINAAWLGIAFLRNPVGVSAIGSGRVGGQPYWGVILGILAFFILRQVIVGPKMGDKVPLLMFGGTFIVSALGVLTTYVPALVPFIAPFYSGIAVNTYLQKEVQGTEADTTLGETRLTPVAGLGNLGVLYAVTRWKPSTLYSILNPGRMLLFLSSFVAIFLGGFRSGLLSAMAMFAISSFVQEKGAGFIKNMVIGIVALIVLSVASLAGVPLPGTVQRAISWMPIFWGTEAEQSANTSTEWRQTMWKIALTSDKYIKNKFLGDGFGFASSELDVMRAAAWGGGGYQGQDAQIEAYMIQGQFHSGPVTTIRVVGYVGLFLYLPLLIAVAFYAWDLAKITKGTPFQFPALFMAVGAIYGPFDYIFIFGSYADSVPSLFFGLGVMKMIKLSYLKWSQSNENAQMQIQMKSSGIPATATV